MFPIASDYCARERAKLETGTSVDLCKDDQSCAIHFVVQSSVSDPKRS